MHVKNIVHRNIHQSLSSTNVCAVKHAWATHPVLLSSLTRPFMRINHQHFGNYKKFDDDPYGMVPIQDIANAIDTTLTPEQQEYVNKLKKKIRGGKNSPRSIYREVPYPHEVVGEGNFMPRMADNAEALIDYALSHIPPKAGKRGSRRKKRMLIKLTIKRNNAAVIKAQKAQANLRRHARWKRIRREVKDMREEARRINELRQMKENLRAEMLSQKKNQ